MPNILEWYFGSGFLFSVRSVVVSPASVDISMLTKNLDEDLVEERAARGLTRDYALVLV